MRHHQGKRPDDEAAVRLVLAGRREMFVPLLRRHHASVLKLCRGILGSETEAQDVAQEAALQAFLNLDRLREPRRFGAWLHSIAANLARSALRHRRVGSLEPLGEGMRPGARLADASPTPEEVRLARDLHDEILGALGRLSTVNREAVIGYYLDGYSYAELAELLNVPVSTIKGRLHKARRQLAPSLAPVAREVFGKDRVRKEEVHVDAQGTIEVTVDDVVKVGLKDGNWTELLRAAGSMDKLRGLFEPLAEQGAPAVVVLREVDGERVLPIWVGARGRVEHLALGLG